MVRKTDKTKSNTPRLDCGVIVCCVLGALIFLGCLAPVLPWRMAAADPTFGSRFPDKRVFSLLTAGDPNRKQVTWMTLSKDICLYASAMQGQDVGSTLAGLLAPIPIIGGAARSCKNWQLCQAHSLERCKAYTAVKFAGLGAAGCFALGAVLSLATVISLCSEPLDAVKKKKLPACMTTMWVSIVGPVLGLGGIAMWVMWTTASFHAIQKSAYYPWPANSLGPYLAAVGVGVLFIGTIMAGVRSKESVRFPGKGKDETEGEGGGGEGQGEDDFGYGGVGVAGEQGAPVGGEPMTGAPMGGAPMGGDPMAPMGGAPPPTLGGPAGFAPPPPPPLFNG